MCVGERQRQRQMRVSEGKERREEGIRERGGM